MSEDKLRLFDYQTKKFMEEKGQIPGPGYYDIQKDER